MNFNYYRKIAKTSPPYIKMSSFKIRVILEILLNSIVCFLQFSSGYIQVSVIIKVDLFSGFYGTYVLYNLEIFPIWFSAYWCKSCGIDMELISFFLQISYIQLECKKYEKVCFFKIIIFGLIPKMQKFTSSNIHSWMVYIFLK